jgi:hypothetical protein
MLPFCDYFALSLCAHCHSFRLLTVHHIAAVLQVVEDGGGQTLLRMSGWRGMSVELVAELDTAADRLLLYLDWWAQLTATRLRLVTPSVHGRG